MYWSGSLAFERRSTLPSRSEASKTSRRCFVLRGLK